MNPFHECRERGDAAEQRFKALAEKNGYQCEFVDDFQSQIRDHVDAILKKSDRSAHVDIKAMKKTSRQDSAVNSDVVWLEFKNVRGLKGWLYGLARFIAFEHSCGFHLIPRDLLAQWAEQNVDTTAAPVMSSKDAYRRVYTRKGRKDQITRVNWSDISHLIKFSLTEGEISPILS